MVHLLKRALFTAHSTVATHQWSRWHFTNQHLSLIWKWSNWFSIFFLAGCAVFGEEIKKSRSCFQVECSFVQECFEVCQYEFGSEGSFLKSMTFDETILCVGPKRAKKKKAPLCIWSLLHFFPRYIVCMPGKNGVHPCGDASNKFLPQSPNEIWDLPCTHIFASASSQKV